MKNSNGGPEYIVEVLTITFTLRMLADYFGTRTFTFDSSVFHKFAKLTAEQIHAQYTVVLHIAWYFESYKLIVLLIFFFLVSVMFTIMVMVMVTVTVTLMLTFLLFCFGIYC